MFSVAEGSNWQCWQPFTEFIAAERMLQNSQKFFNTFQPLHGNIDYFFDLVGLKCYVLCEII